MPIGAPNSQPNTPLQNPFARSTSLAGNSKWTSFPGIALDPPVDEGDPGSVVLYAGLRAIPPERADMALWTRPMRRLALLALARRARWPRRLRSASSAGSSVDVREAPWSVLVLHRAGGEHRSSAAARSSTRRHVLTAAHCVDRGAAAAPRRRSPCAPASRTPSRRRRPTAGRTARWRTSACTPATSHGGTSGGDDVAVLTLTSPLDLNGADGPGDRAAERVDGGRARRRGDARGLRAQGRQRLDRRHAQRDEQHARRPDRVPRPRRRRQRQRRPALRVLGHELALQRRQRRRARAARLDARR